MHVDPAEYVGLRYDPDGHKNTGPHELDRKLFPARHLEETGEYIRKSKYPYMQVALQRCSSGLARHRQSKSEAQDVFTPCLTLSVT